MPKGRKFGGRQKGTPNKSTSDLMAICAKHKVDPFEAMVLAAMKILDPKEQLDGWEKVCQYIHAKRKAIEHSTEDAQGFRVILEDYRSEKK